MSREIDMSLLLKLGALNVSESESERFKRDISNILDAFESLSKINTEGVAPLRHPTCSSELRRPDAVASELSPEELLEGAPDRVGNTFKVPPVV